MRPNTPALAPSISFEMQNEVAKILKNMLEKYKSPTLRLGNLPC